MCRLGVLLIAGAPLCVSAQGPAGGPPPAAFAACVNQPAGAACAFDAPHGEVRGSCRRMREPALVCVPGDGPRGAMRPDGTAGRPPGASSPGGSSPELVIASRAAGATRVSGRLPDTGQGSCFDDARPIPCPPPGAAYYGQDAHYLGAPRDYRDNGDGTLSDRVTGLMWQQGHNAQRRDFPSAQAACTALRLGGHDDWRLPNITELFSLADFAGVTGRRAFIDPRFALSAPSADVLRGDRFAATHRPEMMGQTWSATRYRGDHWDRPGEEAAFFFNFLDGRIKQAPTAAGGPALFYRCVRGAPWGDNDFAANGDGTVSDRAFGLMWQQADDGQPRDWRAALAYCETLRLAGHEDWRLPNAKELQSLVDYGRPAPAIDTSVFRIADPRGWFWTSTTHGEQPSEAVYVCFGKCTSVDGVDVHGAGGQRSDPKAGEASRYRAGRGGQQDEVRIRNYARCVRPAP
ncbi:Lcl C-terminal domain-containing protein [Denitromonas iodatirespirans]|uniref:DUF1566 domain-containing protein n=1 Tax=Denitromonas iodatirespirans TaxID=2795389 RepID=A0A944HCG3_DENI1|nr:DUF1566 domain-containing protein [Denitromonas iodatirespirans]MBT0961166.1 DUF1566 domain-containing protein [Denitromonas iodatirespirans]